MLVFFFISERRHIAATFEVRWHAQRRLVWPLVLWGHQGGPPWALWPVGAAGEGAMWTQAPGVAFLLNLLPMAVGGPLGVLAVLGGAVFRPRGRALQVLNPRISGRLISKPPSGSCIDPAQLRKTEP